MAGINAKGMDAWEEQLSTHDEKRIESIESMYARHLGAPYTQQIINRLKAIYNECKKDYQFQRDKRAKCIRNLTKIEKQQARANMNQAADVRIEYYERDGTINWASIAPPIYDITYTMWNRISNLVNYLNPRNMKFGIFSLTYKCSLHDRVAHKLRESTCKSL